MTQADPLIGRQLANYRIERLLGRGGMAKVYFGWDVNLDRPVAVKVIDERYRGDPVYTERFVREARAVATWRHPNILQVYYAGEQDGMSFYVMEYIRGLDLERVLRSYQESGELMPYGEVLRIGQALANALDYAHRHGVIHRDVKPANVIVSEDGRIVLTDFGLALQTSKGTLGEVFGSPAYIAPEQARNSAEAVGQSDLYSLGVILYEMLTGFPPFTDPSPTSLALKHLLEEPPAPRSFNPYLSPAVEAVLLKTLRKSPAERYQSGQELIKALGEAMAATPPENQPATVPILVTDLGAQPAAVQAPAYSEDFFPSQPEAGPYTLPYPTPAGRPESFRQPANRLALFTFGCATLILLSALAVFISLLLALNRDRDRASGAGLFPSSTPYTTVAAGLETPGTTNSPDTDPAETEPAELLPSTQAPALETEPVPGAETEAAEENQTTESPGTRHFILYYDDTSLYLRNNSGQNLWINGLAFERVLSDGSFTNKYSGTQWGEFYPTLRDDWCMVIEIYGIQEHLTPSQCNRRYLVVRTPTADQEYIFWTKQKDSQEFRVLWQNKEVGRCRIQKNLCDFYLP